MSTCGRGLALVSVAVVAAALVTRCALSLGGVAAALAQEPRHQPGATVAALRFTYPGRFDHHRFISCRFEITHMPGTCVRGLVVANFQLPSNPRLDAVRAPAGRKGVLFALYRAPSSGVVAFTFHFPLSLTDFRQLDTGLEPGVRGSTQGLFFRIKGANYWAMAWIDMNTSDSDLNAISAIISSIRVT